MITRRNFIQRNVPVLTAVIAGAATDTAEAAPRKHTFKLNYAPRLGFFRNVENEIDRLDIYAEWGFKAFEFNGLPRWEVKKVEQLRKRMDNLGMEMGVFVANLGGWKTAGMVDPEQRSNFLQEVTDAMTYAEITGNKWLTAITGPEMSQKISRPQQRANVIESLRRAAEIVEKHKVTLVIEPLNHLVNHDGYFLTRSDEAYEIMRAVNSPYIKILFDIYHQQITEGNLIDNIRRYYSEIAYFQIGDNPGRHEPGTGEINYKNVFKAIYELGFKGMLGLEFSPSIKEEPRGSERVLQSIVEADQFEI